VTPEARHCDCTALSMSDFSCTTKEPFVSKELSTTLMGNTLTSELGVPIAAGRTTPASGTGEQFLLWHANIGDVKSVEEDGPLIVSLLPDEKVKVKRFKFVDDQKRALLSILLQRTLIRSTFNTSDADYELRRSREVGILQICGRY